MTDTPPQLDVPSVPHHVAVIMDGNGRWAKNRGQPRAFGHRAGVRAARKILRAAHKAGVKVLTVFAFSQENWQRPELEVRLLMQLFIKTLSREITALHRNRVRLKFIGEHSGFAPELRAEMARAEKITADNDGLTVVVAVGYGGQQDIVRAAQRLAQEGKDVTAEGIEAGLGTAGLPAPDLLIRTGGEQRISNFMLWQLAYAELYFTDVLWPDFDDAAFGQALSWYAQRERRFGRVPEAA